MSARYAELFAGVGGFRQGIEQSGIDMECVYANEWDKHAAAVYRFRYGDIDEGDVRDRDTGSVPDFDFMVAGFPCQSFSVAGKRAGLEDTRGTLFFEVARFLKDKRPGHILLENVKGLVSHDEGKTFQIMLGVLADLGYRVEWEVLNSTCWVPQNRERVFIVGHLGDGCRRTVFPIREEDEGDNEGIYETTVARTLCGGGHSGGHHSSMTVIAETAYTKSNRKSSRVRLDNATGRLDSGASQAVCRVVRGGDYSEARFRRFTPVECERLQGWGDGWTSVGLYRSNGNGYMATPLSDTQRYKITGNGVTADVIREIVKKMHMCGCL